MALPILTYFEEKPEPMDFVIPSFAMETVGIIAAAGSTGKSFWAIEAGMSVCSAEADQSLLNLGVEKHGKVVILNAEDPEIALHHRLHAIGGYLSNNARKEVAENMILEPLMGRMVNIMEEKWQEAVLRVSDGARLVIFDTLTRWHQLEENSNGDMARVLGVFEMITKKTGASVLLLHHVSKGMARDGRQDEQQATRGAASITDNARWQGFMQTMTKDEAEQYDIHADFRKKYVNTGGNKENYGTSTAEKWLERKEGGVLLPADFLTKKEKTKGGRNE
jgi:RecA-family ATPase